MKNKFEQYNREVIRRFLNPKYSREMKDYDAVGIAKNKVCGDTMKIFLKIKDKKIQDISFQTLGCAAAIASSDALCELVKNKTLSYAKKIDKNKIIRKLKGLPPIKVHCSVLGIEAIRKAIENWENKNYRNE